MMMDEFIIGISMVKEYTDNVNSGNYDEANKVYASINRMNLVV